MGKVQHDTSGQNGSVFTPGNNPELFNLTVTWYKIYIYEKSNDPGMINVRPTYFSGGKIILHCTDGTILFYFN